MGEWNVYKLKDVCSRLSSGKNITAANVHDEGPYPVYGGNGLRGYADVSNFSGECALIGRQGAYCGNVHYFSGTGYMTEHAIVACGNHLSDTRFLSYYLSLQDLGRLSSQSAQPGLSVKALGEEEFDLPDLPTQRRIAAVLGALDDKIEVNRKICENLEAQAQALFKAWFVDFEPFGGKRPEGWKEVSLLDVVELFDMKRIPLSSREREKRKGQFPYYGATSIMDYVDDYLFDGVYLLMGEDGSVAREDGIPYLQYISGQFWVNNHAHIVQGRNGYSTEMLWCALSQTDISTFVTGAVQPKLSQTNMQMIKVPILAMSEMCRFGKSVQPMFDLLRTKRAESRALAAMRDALLTKLMSGELAVEKVEVK